jgi:peptide/nickel transport system substrate-binding protein
MVTGLGAAAVAGLAGCSGGGGGDGGATDTPTDTEAPSDGGDGGDGDGDGDGGDGEDTETPTEAPEDLGKLRLALVKSPIEMDPIVINDVPSTQVVDRVVEGLYAYDEGTGIVPNMAAGEPEVSNDGTKWTVTLKDDPAPTFHNGDEVTSEDVKYSFMAPINEQTENASEVNMIDTIDTPDDKTVVFNLKYPYGAFMTTLTWYVVPKSVREQDKDAFNTGNALVGSGPFTFDEWQEGQYARVDRNPDYWSEPKARLSQVEFVPVEEPTTRVTTLQNKENDVVEEIPPKLYSTVRGMSGAKIQEVPGIGYFYLAFNCNEGPTTDPKVREAVDYCFSMDAAVKNYVEPTGIRQYAPTPKPVSEDWDFPLDEWEQIPHDKNIDEAKKLFEEAGVPKNYQWNIIVPPDDKREQIGVSVSNGLKEAGFSNVEVQRLDWGAFLEKYVSGDPNDYNMYTLGWSGSPDPDAFTYYLLGRTEDTLGVTNGTFYGNNSERGKEAAQMFVDARQSADREERRQLYIDGITMVLEDRAHIPGYNLKNSFGVRDYVKDFAEHAVDSMHICTGHNNTYIEGK